MAISGKSVLTIGNEIISKYGLPFSRRQQEQAIKFLQDLHRHYLTLNQAVVEWFQRQQQRHPDSSSLIVYQIMKWRRWEIRKFSIELALYSFAMIPLLLQKEEITDVDTVSERLVVQMSELLELIGRLKERYRGYLSCHCELSIQSVHESYRDLLLLIYNQQRRWDGLQIRLPTQFEDDKEANVIYQLPYKKHIRVVYDSLVSVRDHIAFTHDSDKPNRDDDALETWSLKKWQLYIQLCLCEELPSITKSSVDEHLTESYTIMFEALRRVCRITDQKSPFDNNTNKVWDQHIELYQQALQYGRLHLAISRSLIVNPYHSGILITRDGDAYVRVICNELKVYQTIVTHALNYGDSLFIALSQHPSVKTSDGINSTDRIKFFHDVHMTYMEIILPVTKRLVERVITGLIGEVSVYRPFANIKECIQYGTVLSHYSDTTTATRLMDRLVDIATNANREIIVAYELSQRQIKQYSILQGSIDEMNITMRETAAFRANTPENMIMTEEEKHYKRECMLFHHMTSEVFYSWCMEINRELAYRDSIPKDVEQLTNERAGMLQSVKQLVTHWNSMYQHSCKLREHQLVSKTPTDMFTAHKGLQRVLEIGMRHSKIVVMGMMSKLFASFDYYVVSRDSELKKLFDDAIATLSMATSPSLNAVLNKLHTLRTAYMNTLKSSGKVGDQKELKLGDNVDIRSNQTFRLHLIDVYTYWIEKALEVGIMKMEMLAHPRYRELSGALTTSEVLQELLSILKPIEDKMEIVKSMTDIISSLSEPALAEVIYNKLSEDHRALLISFDTDKIIVAKAMKEVSLEWVNYYESELEILKEDSLKDDISISFETDNVIPLFMSKETVVRK